MGSRTVPAVLVRGLPSITESGVRIPRPRPRKRARSLSYWDVKNHAWAVAPGDYQVMVGSSSRDIRLQGKFKVTASQ